ncbi:bifunctional homocysteine S-methyltransferase/methylenetetrahydrofolate reductase [bacterium]|nr:MAG: bifunctional homocysteine S-methyltransferase/methylenetetrahydrofolate reductase [bacterium]
MSARTKELLERVHTDILVADGAMGTALYAAGYSHRTCFDELNLSAPHQIETLHRAYVKAGAQIIETNTFGSNTLRLAEHGFERQSREISRAGAILARSAAGEQRYVAGCIGPLNQVLEPIGRVTLDQAREAFSYQIAGLLEGGVDVFFIETMSSLVEIREAILAIRDQCDLPIVASMTFTEDGKTIIGDKPSEVLRALTEYGADVVGANCSVGPQAMMEVIERMARTSDIPLCAQPNAGLPRVVGGRYIYLASPQYFAESALKFIGNGVSIVGGCCGTTPEHIQAIAEAVRGKKRGSPAQISISEKEPEEQISGPRWGVPFNSFRENLGKKFQISVEIDPPRSHDPGPFIRHAQELKAAGVDLINVADSPLARARMSALAMAHLIRRDAGIDVLLHMSCRDRNAIALQSELLGAHTLGVLNILAVTGDPVAIGDYPMAHDIFELDSIRLAHMISQMNQGKDLTGRDLDEPTQFSIGVAANPTAPELEIEIDRFRRKIDAGAMFAFTQPLFEKETLDRFLDRVSGFSSIPLFVGIMPLRSSKHAEFIHNEIPDMFVPESIRMRMQKSGTEGVKAGVEIAQEFLLNIKSSCQGIYLMPPFNKFKMAVDVISVLPRDNSS